MTGMKRAIFQTLTLSIILQMVALAAPFYLQLVVDKAVGPGDAKLLLALLIGFGGLVIIRAASEAIRGWAIIVYGNQMSFQMVGNIFRHLIRLPTAYFEKRHVGDIISRIGSARPIQEALTESVVAILLDGVMAVLTLIVLYIYAPLLCAIVFASVALLALATLFIYPHLRRTEEETIVTKAIENTHVIESNPRLNHGKIIWPRGRARSGVAQSVRRHHQCRDSPRQMAGGAEVFRNAADRPANRRRGLFRGQDDYGGGVRFYAGHVIRLPWLSAAISQIALPGSCKRGLSSAFYPCTWIVLRILFMRTAKFLTRQQPTKSKAQLASKTYPFDTPIMILWFWIMSA